MSELAHSVLLYGFGRDNADLTPITTAETELTLWEWVASSLARVEYVFNDETVVVEMDASNVVDELKLNLKIEHLAARREYDQIPRRDRTPIQVPVTINGYVKSEMDSDMLALRHLANIYTVCNVASPGSFSANHVEIVGSRHIPAFMFYGMLFEDALLDAQDHECFRLNGMDPSNIWEWLRKLGLGVEDLQEPSALSSVFCLLHAAQAPFATPTALLWATQALETLYSTGRGAIEKSLVTRASNFLRVPGQRHKTFDQRLRRFYQARSSFVHGNEPITHPVVVTAGWGDAVGDKYHLVSRDAAFAAGVVLATIREMVRRMVRELRFFERVDTIPL